MDKSELRRKYQECLSIKQSLESDVFDCRMSVAELQEDAGRAFDQVGAWEQKIQELRRKVENAGPMRDQLQAGASHVETFLNGMENRVAIANQTVQELSRYLVSKRANGDIGALSTIEVLKQEHATQKYELDHLLLSFKPLRDFFFEGSNDQAGEVSAQTHHSQLPTNESLTTELNKAHEEISRLREELELLKMRPAQQTSPMMRDVDVKAGAEFFNLEVQGEPQQAHNNGSGMEAPVPEPNFNREREQSFANERESMLMSELENTRESLEAEKQEYLVMARNLSILQREYDELNQRFATMQEQKGMTEMSYRKIKAEKDKLVMTNRALEKSVEEYDNEVRYIREVNRSMENTVITLEQKNAQLEKGKANMENPEVPSQKPSDSGAVKTWSEDSVVNSVVKSLSLDNFKLMNVDEDGGNDHAEVERRAVAAIYEAVREAVPNKSLDLMQPMTENADEGITESDRKETEQHRSDSPFYQSSHFGSGTSGQGMMYTMGDDAEATSGAQVSRDDAASVESLTKQLNVARNRISQLEDYVREKSTQLVNAKRLAVEEAEKAFVETRSSLEDQISKLTEELRSSQQKIDAMAAEHAKKETEVIGNVPKASSEGASDGDAEKKSLERRIKSLEDYIRESSAKHLAARKEVTKKLQEQITKLTAELEAAKMEAKPKLESEGEKALGGGPGTDYDSRSEADTNQSGRSSPVASGASTRTNTDPKDVLALKNRVSHLEGYVRESSARHMAAVKKLKEEHRAELSAIQAERAGEQMSLHQAIQKAKAFEDHVEVLNARLESSKDEYEVENACLRKTFIRAQGDLEKLREEFDRYKQKNSDMGEPKVGGKGKNARGKRSDQEELKKLQSGFSKMQQIVTETNAQLERKTAEGVVLRQQLSSYNNKLLAARHENEVLWKHKSMLEEQARTTEDQISQLKRDLIEAEATLEKERLNTSHECATEGSTGQEEPVDIAEHKVLLKSYEDLQETNARLVEEKEAVEAAHARLEAEKVELEVEIKDAEKKYDKMEAEHKNLAEENVRMQYDICHLQRLYTAVVDDTENKDTGSGGDEAVGSSDAASRDQDGERSVNGDENSAKTNHAAESTALRSEDGEVEAPQAPGSVANANEVADVKVWAAEAEQEALQAEIENLKQELESMTEQRLDLVAEMRTLTTEKEEMLTLLEKTKGEIEDSINAKQQHHLADGMSDTSGSMSHQGSNIVKSMSHVSSSNDLQSMGEITFLAPQALRESSEEQEEHESIFTPLVLLINSQVKSDTIRVDLFNVMSVMKSSVKRLEDQITDLKERLEEGREKQQELSLALAESEMKADGYEAKIASLEGLSSTFKEQLTASEEELSTLQKYVNDSKHHSLTVSTMLEERKALEEKIEILEKQVDENYLKTLEVEKNSLTTDVQQLERKLLEAQNESAELRIELDKWNEGDEGVTLTELRDVIRELEEEKEMREIMVLDLRKQLGNLARGYKGAHRQMDEMVRKDHLRLQIQRSLVGEGDDGTNEVESENMETTELTFSELLERSKKRLSTWMDYFSQQEEWPAVDSDIKLLYSELVSLQHIALRNSLESTSKEAQERSEAAANLVVENRDVQRRVEELEATLCQRDAELVALRKEAADFEEELHRNIYSSAYASPFYYR